jgi:hypothetical protein
VKKVTKRKKRKEKNALAHHPDDEKEMIAN